MADQNVVLKQKRKRKPTKINQAVCDSINFNKSFGEGIQRAKLPAIISEIVALEAIYQKCGWCFERFNIPPVLVCTKTVLPFSSIVALKASTNIAKLPEATQAEIAALEASLKCGICLERVKIPTMLVSSSNTINFVYHLLILLI